ncbi:MAG: sugar porter family MFS transporter [Chitinophagaceae bacterium]|nr:sugar porter family MFS transporter [Chitinophagaceae bacterium]
MQKSKYSLYLIVISVIASLGGLLFGFDIAVISGVLPLVQQQFSLSPAQEGWFVSSALVGCIVGVAFSGESGDRFGRKKMLVVSAVLFFLSAAGCTFFYEISSIIISRMVGGVGIGVASIMVPLYISEIAPAAIRGRLVTGYQLAITIGILLAYLANAGLMNYANSPGGEASGGLFHWLYVEQVWRGMFSMFVIPSLLFLVGLILVPESPRWLVLKGDTRRAIDILGKISSSIPAAHAEVETIQKSSENRQAAYRELWAPGMRKALALGLLLPLLSQLSGINAIIYYGPTILQHAGIPVSESLSSQILFGAGIVLFTFIAIWKVDHLGRRKLYLLGSAGATISLFLTGLCFYTGNTSGIWLFLCVLLFLASFAFSIGPLKFVIAAEIFPNKIRGRAMALSIMVMWISDTIVGQITPIALRNWGTAATFWMFATFCLIGFIVVAKLLPETKGRSLEQIEDFWKVAH